MLQREPVNETTVAIRKQAEPANGYRIRPARPGVLLRDPATGEAIPQEGAVVTLSGNRAFWLRRVKDGDAVMSAEKGAEKPAAKTRQAAQEQE